MMGGTALVTGFPGFIAERLIRLLRGKGTEVHAVALPGVADAAQAAARDVEGDGHGTLGLVTGDITEPGLALTAESQSTVLPRVTRLFHLAALYDLAVPAEDARRVNVEGTRNVLDLCESLPSLERLIYFSTCYVAGRRGGTILESELTQPPSFRNHYESTKHAAEALVRERVDRLPVVIIRPSVVVGDSQSGETAKYDGPYYLMAGLARLERAGLRLLAPLYPDFGSGDSALNIVPVDYVVAGTVALADDPDVTGGTFHLSDPSPLSTREFTRAVYAAFGFRGPWLRFPAWMGKACLSLPGMSRLLGIPRQVFDYYGGAQSFDTTGACSRLELHDIRCPALPDYLPSLVQYVRDHPRPERTAS